MRQRRRSPPRPPPASVPERAGRLASALAPWLWPGFALLVYIDLHPHLHGVVRELPDAIRAASKMSVGPVSVEVGRPEMQPVIERLRGLSDEAVQVLMAASAESVNTLYFVSALDVSRTRYSLRSDAELMAVAELHAARLVALPVELEAWRLQWQQATVPAVAGRDADMRVLRDAAGSAAAVLDTGQFSVTREGRDLKQLMSMVGAKQLRWMGQP